MGGSNVFLASLFNATGVAVVVAVSLYVQYRFPRAWFKYWTWAFTAGLVSLSIEAIALGAGRTLAMSLIEVVAVVLAIVFQWQTIQALRGQTLSAAFATGLVVALVVPGLGALLAGVPVLAVLAVPMLVFSANFLGLGLAMTRSQAPMSVQTWLAVPLIALALLPVTYPLNVGTPYLWVGYYAGGVLNLIVGIGMVVASMELSAQELQAANAQLKQYDTLKMQFFNNMSHEIRTPLTAIRAAAVAMERGGLETPTFSLMISDQVVRLDRMLRDILDVAQLEAGTLAYAFEPCDLAGVVEAGCHMFRPLYAEAGLTLVCDVPEDALEVEGDRDRLMQVVANLLENARKFTPRGGHVVASAVRVPGGVRIAVADDGPGVPAALHEAVFEKFFQADGSTARRVGGTGLGLAICRAIVEAGHRGRIWVEPSAAGGATFPADLPLSPPAAPAAARSRG